MKFVEEHLTKHHLFHKPHLWFFALLTSPIHLAEMHYKKKYHLNFTHARKLFLFDTILLLTIIILISATIFWFTYNPTVTDLVYLNIKTSQTRIISGDYVEYQINYKNESNVKLVEPILKLDLPPGFILDDAKPLDKYADNEFLLEDLEPMHTASVQIAGWLFTTPDVEEKVMATLSYRQETRQRSEQKTSSIIKILRGSIIETTVQSRQIALVKDTFPLTVIIKNNGQQKLNNITVPAPANITTEDSWNILELNPGTTKTLTGMVSLDLNNYEPIVINITPQIEINGQKIAQATYQHNIAIARPQVDLNSYWLNNPTSLKPNQTATLVTNITNSGNVKLTNAKLEVPIPTAIINLNNLIVSNLNDIEPSETKTVNLQIPIKYWPQGGTDLKLILSPQVKAQIAEIPNSLYTQTTETPVLQIGTQLDLVAEIKYYTNEGDQLGRGPLPPQVGKETKYWATITLANSTSKISNLSFTATLPNYVTWTGKSSVSHGQDVKYNATNRQISWNLNSLSAYATAGIYFEIALTPTTNQINTSPALLKNIQASAHDTYIDVGINKSSTDLDISLPTDTIVQAKGTKVQ